MKSKLLGHSANDLFWFILPLVLPALLARYDLSYTQAGGILTIYLMFTAVGSVVMGKLSDHISRKHIMSYGFLLSAAGLIASGFAPTLPVFLVLISITAIGVSTFHPVMYAVIVESDTTGKSRFLGLYESFGTAAILLMFLVNGFLLSRIGVRGVMIVTAIPALIMAVVYRFSNSFENTGAGGQPRLKSERKARPIAQGETLRFALFLVTVILRVVSITALLNFLPLIFVKFFDMGEGQAAYSTAVYFAGGILGAILTGKLSEQFNSFVIIIIGTVFISAAMLIIAGSLPVWVYIMVIMLFGAFVSGCTISQNLLMNRLGGSLGKGEIFGILMGASTVAAALSPSIFGLVLDFTGYKQALYIFSIPLALSFFILLWLFKAEQAEKALVKVSL